MNANQPGLERYPHLFSPFRLGRLELPNRMVVPGLTTGFGARGGDITERLCRYLRARARGGFGLIVTENLAVDLAGRSLQTIIMAESDARMPGLVRLAQAVHDEGGLVMGQLVHAGRQTRAEITEGRIVAPSAIPCPINREMPHALTPDEVVAMERAFVDAACRLEAAGFDGVEIHGAHGYLVAEFLSPYSNARTDEYGGAFENRMRFLLNIVDGIKARCGAGFPLSVRISAKEFAPGGLDVADAIQIAGALAQHGVDALSVSVGVYESFNRLSMVSGEPEGQWLPLAGQVKRGTTLPVMGVGRIVRASTAEEALAAGLIDLAAIGRASMADPELPRKTLAGREDDIILCMGCNLCLGRAARPHSICPVNPEIGREGAFDLPPASKLNSVAVLGDSYSALTFAWLAARRGHEVTVFEPERTAECAGLWRLRAEVPGQSIVAETAAAMRRRAAAEGVSFASGDGAPGGFEVVAATRRFRPFGSPVAANGTVSRDPIEVLAGSNTFAAQNQRAVVMGDDLCSAEAAVLLAEGGAEVTLWLPGKGVAMDAHPGFREVTGRALAERGVVVEREVEDVLGKAPPLSGGLIVVGRTGKAAYEDPAAWSAPALNGGDVLWLDDAYEPGAMARGVYDAVDAAIALGAAEEA
jgi:2,4-dienoyl-CoA reductase-like NADH-dependent reductase (Old Yellow Enzyme family)